MAKIKKEYERLTEKTRDCFQYDLKDFKHKIGEFGDYDAFFAYSMAVKRLGELEDKIENGTLVEIPCKVGDNAVAIIDTLCYPNAIYNVKLKDLAYIVEDENGDVTFQHITRIFGTEAEAEKRLEEIRNGNNDRLSK